MNSHSSSDKEKKGSREDASMSHLFPTTHYLDGVGGAGKRHPDDDDVVVAISAAEGATLGAGGVVASSSSPPSVVSGGGVATAPPTLLSVGDLVRHVDTGARGVIRYIGPMYKRAAASVKSAGQGEAGKKGTVAAPAAPHPPPTPIAAAAAAYGRQEGKKQSHARAAEGDSSGPTAPQGEEEGEVDQFTFTLVGGGSANTNAIEPWFGIEWERGGIGKNNGVIEGIRYFEPYRYIPSLPSTTSSSSSHSSNSSSFYCSMLRRNKIRVQKSLVRAMYSRYTMADDVPLVAGGGRGSGGGAGGTRLPRTSGLDPFYRNAEGVFVNVHYCDCTANDSLKCVGYAEMHVPTAPTSPFDSNMNATAHRGIHEGVEGGKNEEETALKTTAAVDPLSLSYSARTRRMQHVLSHGSSMLDDDASLTATVTEGDSLSATSLLTSPADPSSPCAAGAPPLPPDAPPSFTSPSSSFRQSLCSHIFIPTGAQSTVVPSSFSHRQQHFSSNAAPVGVGRGRGRGAFASRASSSASLKPDSTEASSPEGSIAFLNTIAIMPSSFANTSPSSSPHLTLSFLFPNLHTLSLTGTLIQSWSSLWQILSSLPSLAHVNASNILLSEQMDVASLQEQWWWHRDRVRGTPLERRRGGDGGGIAGLKKGKGVAPNGRPHSDSSHQRTSHHHCDPTTSSTSTFPSSSPPLNYARPLLPPIAYLNLSDTNLTPETLLFFLAVFPTLKELVIGNNAPPALSKGIKRMSKKDIKRRAAAAHQHNEEEAKKTQVEAEGISPNEKKTNATVAISSVAGPFFFFLDAALLHSDDDNEPIIGEEDSSSSLSLLHPLRLRQAAERMLYCDADIAEMAETMARGEDGKARGEDDAKDENKNVDDNTTDHNASIMAAMKSCCFFIPTFSQLLLDACDTLLFSVETLSINKIDVGGQRDAAKMAKYRRNAAAMAPTTTAQKEKAEPFSTDKTEQTALSTMEEGRGIAAATNINDDEITSLTPLLASIQLLAKMADCVEKTMNDALSTSTAATRTTRGEKDLNSNNRGCEGAARNNTPLPLPLPALRHLHISQCPISSLSYKRYGNAIVDGGCDEDAGKSFQSNSGGTYSSTSSSPSSPSSYLVLDRWIDPLFVTLNTKANAKKKMRSHTAEIVAGGDVSDFADNDGGGEEEKNTREILRAICSTKSDAVISAHQHLSSLPSSSSSLLAASRFLFDGVKCLYARGCGGMREWDASFGSLQWGHPSSSISSTAVSPSLNASAFCADDHSRIVCFPSIEEVVFSDCPLLSHQHQYYLSPSSGPDFSGIGGGEAIAPSASATTAAAAAAVYEPATARRQELVGMPERLILLNKSIITPPEKSAVERMVIRRFGGWYAQWVVGPAMIAVVDAFLKNPPSGQNTKSVKSSSTDTCANVSVNGVTISPSAARILRRNALRSERFDFIASIVGEGLVPVIGGRRRQRGGGDDSAVVTTTQSVKENNGHDSRKENSEEKGNNVNNKNNTIQSSQCEDDALRLTLNQWSSHHVDALITPLVLHLERRAYNDPNVVMSPNGERHDHQQQSSTTNNDAAVLSTSPPFLNHRIVFRHTRKLLTEAIRDFVDLMAEWDVLMNEGSEGHNINDTREESEDESKSEEDAADDGIAHANTTAQPKKNKGFKSLLRVVRRSLVAQLEIFAFEDASSSSLSSSAHLSSSAALSASLSAATSAASHSASRRIAITTVPPKAPHRYQDAAANPSAAATCDGAAKSLDTDLLQAREGSQHSDKTPPSSSCSSSLHEGGGGGVTLTATTSSCRSSPPSATSTSKSSLGGKASVAAAKTKGHRSNSNSTSHAPVTLAPRYLQYTSHVEYVCIHVTPAELIALRCGGFVSTVKEHFHQRALLMRQKNRGGSRDCQKDDASSEVPPSLPSSSSPPVIGVQSGGYDRMFETLVDVRWTVKELRRHFGTLVMGSGGGVGVASASGKKGNQITSPSSSSPIANEAEEGGGQCDGVEETIAAAQHPDRFDPLYRLQKLQEEGKETEIEKKESSPSSSKSPSTFHKVFNAEEHWSLCNMTFTAVTSLAAAAAVKAKKEEEEEKLKAEKLKDSAERDVAEEKEGSRSLNNNKLSSNTPSSSSQHRSAAVLVGVNKHVDALYQYSSAQRSNLDHQRLYDGSADEDDTDASVPSSLLIEESPLTIAARHVLSKAAQQKNSSDGITYRSDNPAGNKFPPLRVLFPSGSIFLFHLDHELMLNEGAVARGMHCKEMLRGGDAAHAYRINNGDIIVVAVIM